MSILCNNVNEILLDLQEKLCNIIVKIILR